MRRTTIKRTAAFGFLLLITVGTATACLWDYDTLRDERRGLPGIAEVLAGKWEKHSQFFYEQRVLKMKALIAKEPANLDAYDNLAVAYEKLNNQDAAIEVMTAKEKIRPRQYTTEANLGTFYIHKGDFQQGAEHIRKALQINLNAHFGREEYQLQLVEFLLAGKQNPELLRDRNFLGLGPQPGGSHFGIVGARPSAITEPAGPTTLAADKESFAYWAMMRHGRDLAEYGVKPNAIEGIVGILRFGTGTSAELYLTLGDLLTLRGDKNLAYRAYQRALDFNHPRSEYIRSVMSALKGSIHNGADITPERIAAERAAAEKWANAYQAYEDDLVRAGKNTDDDTNYAAFYAEHGPRDEDVSPTLAEQMLPREPSARAAKIFTAIVAVVTTISMVVFVIRRRRRRLKAALGKA